MEPLVIAIFVGVAILIVFAMIYGYQQAKKRREDLAKLADALSMTFSPVDPFNIPTQYGHLSDFAQGHSRQAYNVVHGQRGSYSIKAFDYVYYTTETSTDSKGNTTTREVAHYLSAVTFDVAVNFPSLVIRPEGFFDKVAAAFGFDDIDFESAEFSRLFYVGSSDKKFAYDVIHARMMEYLLQHQGWTLRLQGPVMLYHKGGWLQVNQFGEGIEITESFLKQIPAFVWERLRAGE